MMRDVPLWLGFLIVGSATQLLFKLASEPLANVEFGPLWLWAALHSPVFALAVGSYLATFALWIVILQRTALSKAFVLTALVYVTVTLGSAVWLGEQVNAAQAAGLVLVMTGIALMGWTDGASDGASGPYEKHKT